MFYFAYRAHIKEIKTLYLVQRFSSLDDLDNLPDEAIFTFYPVNAHLILGILCRYECLI